MGMRPYVCSLWAARTTTVGNHDRRPPIPPLILLRRVVHVRLLDRGDRFLDAVPDGGETCTNALPARKLPIDQVGIGPTAWFTPDVGRTLSDARAPGILCLSPQHRVSDAVAVSD